MTDGMREGEEGEEGECGGGERRHPVASLSERPELSAPLLAKGTEPVHQKDGGRALPLLRPALRWSRLVVIRQETLRHHHAQRHVSQETRGR